MNDVHIFIQSCLKDFFNKDLDNVIVETKKPIPKETVKQTLNPCQSMYFIRDHAGSLIFTLKLFPNTPENTKTFYRIAEGMKLLSILPLQKSYTVKPLKTGVGLHGHEPHYFLAIEAAKGLSIGDFLLQTPPEIDHINQACTLFHRLGNALAEIHAIPVKVQPERHAQLMKRDDREMHINLKKMFSLSSLSLPFHAKELTASYQHLRTFHQKHPPQIGLLHGDLHPYHVFFQDQEERLTFIDIGLLYYPYGPLAYDVSHLILSIEKFTQIDPFSLKKQEIAQLQTAFKKGYHLSLPIESIHYYDLFYLVRTLISVKNVLKNRLLQNEEAIMDLFNWAATKITQRL